MHSQFSGGWGACNDQVQPVVGCGKTGSSQFPLEGQEGKAERWGGGSGVLHRFSLPWYTVPWLLDRRNNICIDRQVWEGAHLIRSTPQKPVWLECILRLCKEMLERWMGLECIEPCLPFQDFELHPEQEGNLKVWGRKGELRRQQCGRSD